LKILFFAPHTAVWIHAFPEALAAEAARQGGHEIIYVGCGGLLSSHCVAMSAFKVPFEAARADKERICSLCRKNEAIIRGRFGFAGPDLTGLANADDLRFAEELLASTAQEKYFDVVLDGVEAGRMALYEILIQIKKGTLDLAPGEWLRYRASLKNAIVVLKVAQRLFDEHRPDRVVVYNALYSVNRVICRLAELRGVPQYYLHAGDNLSKRLQTLVLARNHAFHYYEYLRGSIWPRWRERPCSPQAMRSSSNHLLEVARGRSAWAYSAASKPGVDIRKIFGIREDQRIICASMSSDDERFSGEIAGVLPSLDGLLFPKQVDWIRALIDYVVDRKDLFLVVRVHPREFPNKREGVLSEHAKTLEGAFATLPGNVKVNWPADDISLFDLANVTDVFANGWSSAGKEMAWLGLPVVLYSNNLTLYPADLNYVGTTLSDYYRQIDRALDDGWDAERIRRTYRWCAIEYEYSPLDISESFARSEHGSFVQKAVKKILRTIAGTREQQGDCRGRAARLSSAERMERILRDQLMSPVDAIDPSAPVSYHEETHALKVEVQRVVSGLFGAGAQFPANTLAAKLQKFAGA
jgi:hypothetical protein